MSTNIKTSDPGYSGLEDPIVQELKNKFATKLQNSSWVEMVEMKSKRYIQTNGLKTITVDEIFDTIFPEALASFPKDVKQQLGEDLQQALESFMTEALLKNASIE